MCVCMRRETWSALWFYHQATRPQPPDCCWSTPQRAWEETHGGIRWWGRSIKRWCAGAANKATMTPSEQINRPGCIYVIKKELQRRLTGPPVAVAQGQPRRQPKKESFKSLTAAVFSFRHLCLVWGRARIWNGRLRIHLPHATPQQLQEKVHKGEAPRECRHAGPPFA